MKAQYSEEHEDITVAFDRQEHVFVRVRHDAIDWKANIINTILDLEGAGEQLVWNPEKRSLSKHAAHKLITQHLGQKFPDAPNADQTYRLIREMLFGREVVENGQTRFVGQRYLETADGWINGNKQILLKIKESAIDSDTSEANYESYGV